MQRYVHMCTHVVQYKCSSMRVARSMWCDIAGVIRTCCYIWGPHVRRDLRDAANAVHHMPCDIHGAADMSLLPGYSLSLRNSPDDVSPSMGFTEDAGKIR
eukprot:3067512-Pyramimonas_sp.AAC.1